MLIPYRITQTRKFFVFAALIFALISQACNFASAPSVPNSTNTAKPANTRVPTSTQRPPTTTPERTATSVPTNINVPVYDLYAGFTENKEIPFVMLHSQGEKLGVMKDSGSSEPTGVTWISSSGEAIVIYTDKNGLPTSLVAGEEII